VSTNQAVAAGGDYHLDKCGPTGLSQTRRLEEEGEGGQRYWIARSEP
jgi:hypothetical protein